MLIHFSKKTLQNCTHKNESNIIFCDRFFCISNSDKDKTTTYIFQNESWFIYIYGNINLLDNVGLSNNNLAQYFCEKYTNNIHNFLSVSNGSFLLTIYNKKQNILTLCNDNLGLKHGYIYHNNGDTYVSASVRDILAILPNGSNEIDVNSLRLYFTFQYVPNPYSMFKNIRQIPLRTIVSVGDIIKYEIKYSQIHQMLLAHKSLENDDLADLLAHSLKRQIGNVSTDVGAFLSGGMDTSSNIAISVEKLGIKPTVFTASFDEATYDETPYAKIVAEKYNLKHIITKIDSEIILNTYDISKLYDNPIADRAVLAQYKISKIAKQMGIDFMLSGEGGDEILGYPRNMLDEQHVARELPINDGDLAEYYYKTSGLMNKDLVNSVVKNSTYSPSYLQELYESQDSSLSAFEKILYGQWQMWLIDNVLMKDVQIFNHFGIKHVSPYIDESAMRYVTLLSGDEKVDLLQNKKLLRNAMNKYLPAKTINKPKHKFHIPITEWLRGASYEIVYETITAKNSLTNKYLDIGLVTKMLEEHRINNADYNRPLWSIFFVENWYQSIQKL